MNEQVREGFEAELEVSKGFSIQQMEERLELGWYCCDYDGERPERGSCGYE